MKKIFLLAAISLLISTGSFAQIRLGGLLGYGSEVEQWGLGVNAEFFINEKMAISPNLLFYFPEKRGGFKYSFWELNGNFHYYFLSEEPVSLYGLAGLNLLNAHVKVDNNSFVGSYENSDSELGLNLGIGANFHVGGVLPYVELKYVAGDADQAVVMLGVKFPLTD